ncbi:unnamed protein product [Peronospora belbahrii]|uniref:Uncharacterized protein n=1 Tax=Peronospora belbahrii TaxID=622444 RepID=A0AAU9KTA7_9STRA|nr:unnamed protein product [Peronospora belbahrii]
MTHHLAAYVFQLTGTKSKPSEIDATVLARHESPGFSLVSYRRSGSNSRDAGCDLPAIGVANSNKFATVEINTPTVFSSDDLKRDLAGRLTFKPSYEKMNTNNADTDHRQFQFSRNHKRLKHEEKQQHKMQPEAKGNSDSSFFETTKDTYSWQHGTQARNCRFREKGQHLLILWSFFQSLSLSDLNISLKLKSEHICSHWLRAAAIRRSPSPSSSHQLKAIVASFLNGIFEQAYAQPGIKSTTILPFTRESSTIQVTALLFLRTLSSQSVHRLLHSSCSFDNAELSKSELQIRFVLLISDLYDAVGVALQEVSAPMAGLTRRHQIPLLPALVDDVLSLVYSRPRLRQLRSRISALLLVQQTSLSEGLSGVFQTFTALVRERLIVSATRYRISTQFQYPIPRTSIQELWNQCWLLDPRSMNVVDVSRSGCRHDMRLVDIVQLLFEFGCVDVTITDNSMSLQSAFSVLGDTAVAPMTLVLDGKFRLFRVLPSGMSSMIATAGSWSIGDYTAMFSGAENSLIVNLFSFAQQETGGFAHHTVDLPDLKSYLYAGVIRLRRVCISIRLAQKLNNDGVNPTHLCAVVHGTTYNSAYSSQSQRVDMLRFSERTVLERAAIWNEAKWEPLCEFQAECIPFPTKNKPSQRVCFLVRLEMICLSTIHSLQPSIKIKTFEIDRLV